MASGYAAEPRTREPVNEREAQQIILEAQRSFPDEQFVGAVPGRLYAQGPDGNRRYGDGLVAISRQALHFGTRRLRRVEFVQVPLDAVTAAETATAQFAETQEDGVSIDLQSGLWFLVMPAEESELLLEFLDRATAPLSEAPTTASATVPEAASASDGLTTNVAADRTYDTQALPATAPQAPLDSRSPGPTTMGSNTKRRVPSVALGVAGVLVLASLVAFLVVRPSGGGDQGAGGTLAASDQQPPSDASGGADNPAATDGIGNDQEPESDPSGLGTAASTDTYDMGGFSIEVTNEADWTVPDDPEIKSDGAMRVWDLFGPDGEEISIYYTPDERAKPSDEYVTDREPFAANVSDAERVVLNGFPTPACESAVCDDYVLNGPFGGIAILAADSNGPISAVAADIARSVMPN